MAGPPNIDWNAVISDPRFQILHRKKQGFLTGLMVFSVAFYFLLPIGAAYFQDLFKITGLGRHQLRPALRADRVRGGLARRVLLLEAGRRRIRPAGARDRRRLRERAGDRMSLRNSKTLLWGMAALLPVVCTAAFAQGAVTPEYRWLTFAVFAAIISLTMYVTYVAAKRVKSASDFYTAGGGVTGLQNGWAIAGDYLSAASFLGIAGLISQYGYDGFMYSVGWLVAYITVLLLIAEPCRNIGRYTLPTSSPIATTRGRCASSARFR